MKKKHPRSKGSPPCATGLLSVGFYGGQDYRVVNEIADIYNSRVLELLMKNATRWHELGRINSARSALSVKHMRNPARDVYFLDGRKLMEFESPYIEAEAVVEYLRSRWWAF